MSHKTYFVSIFVKMILMVNIITFGQTSKEGITKAIITLETEIILYQKYNITSELSHYNRNRNFFYQICFLHFSKTNIPCCLIVS